MSPQTLTSFVSGHSGILLVAGIAVAVFWAFQRNQDLQEHRQPLLLALAGVGAVLALAWVVWRCTGSHFTAVVLLGLLGFLSIRILFKELDRTINDFLGGFLFDLVFSEGMFAETLRPQRKLPNLALLHHWRANGHARKAYRVARRNLRRTRDAYPLWLFAAETAALHLNDLPAALRLIRRCAACREFSDDQHIFARSQLRAWAAARGFELTFPSERANAVKVKPLTRIASLRHQGHFDQARKELHGLLRKEPENLAAAMLLVRVYAEDLHQRDQAERQIQALGQKPFVDAATLEFLHRSLEPWLATPSPTRAPAPSPALVAAHPSASGRIKLSTPPVLVGASAAAPAELPEPVSPAADSNELLDGLSPPIAALVSARRLGTAVEELERQLHTRPNAFDLLLELAQVHIVHCGNLRTGERILTKIDCDPSFSCEQKALAKARLNTWRQRPCQISPTFRY